MLLPATPGWVSLPVVVCGSPPLLAGVSGRRWCVMGLWLVCGVVGPSPLLAEVPVCYSPPLLAGFRRRWWCAVPRYSWLGPAGGGGAWRVVCGVWCVVCGGGVLVGLWLWLVPRHSWRRLLCATPRNSWLGFAAGGGGRSSPLLAEGPGRGSPPLLAGVRWRRWCVVGLWLVCGVVGPSPLLAEVPVCYSPPLLAGFRCRWWCAVPRHSWLGPAGGGGAWCVVCGVWCVVCGGGVLAGLWLVCGVVGPSPLLAEVPVCYSPPLLAGFRCRWWWAVPATPGWGPLAAVVCGVWRWCVGGVVAGVWCGWSLATPGGGSCVLLPATPGWVSLPVVVGGPRHSWLRVQGAVPRHSWLESVGGGVWRGRSLATPGGGSCVLLPATPGWVSVPVMVCGPRPLLAGVRWRRWCVVCGVWCVVCGVWCVVCGGGVLVGLRLVCGVVGSSPLPAEVPVCYSPPLLAGFRCRRWWAFLATPGGGSRARFPATPGWVSLSAVVCGVWCVVCGVWRAAVACVVGLWLVCGEVGPSPLLAEVPVCYSPPLLAGCRCRWWCGAPRHSWLGPAGCGGVFRGRGCPLLCVFVVCLGVRGGRAVLCVACLWCLCFWWCGVVVRWVCLPGALPLGPGVCVCAVWPFVLVWVAWGGGVVRGVAVVRARVCARGVLLVGWGVSYLGWFSSSVVGMFQKAEEEVL